MDPAEAVISEYWLLFFLFKPLAYFSLFDFNPMHILNGTLVSIKCQNTNLFILMLSWSVIIPLKD